MAHYREFNDMLLKMINDMTQSLPDSSELAMAKSLADTFFRMQPESSYVADRFWHDAKDKHDAIVHKDSKVLLHTLGILFQRPQLVKSLWKKLSSDNHNVVFAYLEALYDIARKIHGTPHVKDDVPEGHSCAGLLVVYNNMWKEFLGHLDDKGLHGISDEIKESITRLEGLMQNCGAETEFVHGCVSNDLEPLLNSQGFSETEIMAQLVPPSDPSQALAIDAEKLRGVKFRLSTTLTYTDVLEKLAESDDIHQIALYWHYLKLITLVLKACPPQLLGVVSSLAQNLVQTMNTQTA